MPKYVIERDMPGAGNMSEEELREAAKASNKVLAEMGPDIQWVESFITTDKIYCVYIAKNEELLRIHGEKSGFPVHKISEIRSMNDPAKAEDVKVESV